MMTDWWFVQMIHWSIQHDSLPTSDQLQMCLECVACVLQDAALWSIIALDEHASWVCSLIAGLHQLLASGVLFCLQLVHVIFVRCE
jgi:hypothetical protein